MITSDYLKRVLPELDEFKNKDMSEHVLDGNGYDGIMAILENLRSSTFPTVIVEDRSSGSITIDAGPVDVYSLPVWVMVAGENGDEYPAFESAFALVKKILKLFVRDQDTADLDGIDLSRIGYYKRFAPGCYGYEILLTFRVDIDLSL